jgi:hypothetical protein
MNMQCNGRKLQLALRYDGTDKFNICAIHCATLQFAGLVKDQRLRGAALNDPFAPHLLQ